MGKSRRSRRSSNRRLPTYLRSDTPYTDYIERYGRWTSYNPAADVPIFEKLGKRIRQVPYEPAPTKTSPSYGRISPKKRGFAPVTTTAPQSVVKEKICVDRSTRKEIMHATGNAGKRGQKSPVWKKSSKVRC